MDEFGLGWALAGILLTAGLATLGTWVVNVQTLRHERETKQEEIERHARYLAIRVICVLDPFVSDCVEVVHDEGVPSPPEREYVSCVSTPSLTLPEDVDWRAVKPDLMYKILGFPSEIAVADQTIGRTKSEISTPPDHNEFFWERTIRYGKLGLAAMNLADDLRGIYGIPARDDGDWNVRESLELRLTKVEKQKADSEAKQAEFHRRMWEEHEARKAVEAVPALPVSDRQPI
ncbi:hypothetical protein [Aurantimonas sp. A3-2-R12]|uniref:hypothetical protein n=1 Tax=Aurantimonas sp. A3-2-R12 TaxID=3114362 RepID=UPI002E17972F|nr:hypothetical protein [Aurantimonas sp. A3-2-R12]